MKRFDFGHFTLEWDDVPGLPASALEGPYRSFKEKVAKGMAGFYEWPATCSRELLDDIEGQARKNREAYEGAICFGIGGSHLGGAAILQALQSAKERAEFPIHWLYNVDPPAFDELSHALSEREYCAVAISKSGQTLETLSSFFHFSKNVDQESVVVITDPKSGELRRLAGINKWKSFEVPPEIGGRFSVLTPVGLYPCALGGVPISEVIEGAIEMRNQLEALGPNNPALLFADFLYQWDVTKGATVQYLMPYWSNLSLLADWYVQLWGESLGKAGSGPTPGAALGSRDQHSLLQLFKEGPSNKVVGFVGVEGEKAPTLQSPPFLSPPFEHLGGRPVSTLNHFACASTRESLTRSQIPTYLFQFSTLTPSGIGALLFFFQAACGYAGELYGINAYDQPGVEEAKLLLKAKLTGSAK